MGWKPSLSSSGQSSVKKTLSSGWLVKNTRPLILRQSCCPKPNIFIQFLLNPRPLKRYDICLFLHHKLHGCCVAKLGFKSLTPPEYSLLFFLAYLSLRAVDNLKYLYYRSKKNNSRRILKCCVDRSPQQLDLCEQSLGAAARRGHVFSAYTSAKQVELFLCETVVV